jgi:hypothetical protein
MKLTAILVTLAMAVITRAATLQERDCSGDCFITINCPGSCLCSAEGVSAPSFAYYELA